MSVLKSLNVTILSSAFAIGLAMAQNGAPAQNDNAQPTKHSDKNGASTSAHPSDQEIANAQSEALVWVDTSKHVYHKGGSEYGKTKHGKFMSEENAQKQGYHEAKKSAEKQPVPHKGDQSGVDSSIDTHKSTPPKRP
jgi:hypothetical protein